MLPCVFSILFFFTTCVVTVLKTGYASFLVFLGPSHCSGVGTLPDSGGGRLGCHRHQLLAPMYSTQSQKHYDLVQLQYQNHRGPVRAPMDSGHSHCNHGAGHRHSHGFLPQKHMSCDQSTETPWFWTAKPVFTFSIFFSTFSPVFFSLFLFSLFKHTFHTLGNK